MQAMLALAHANRQLDLSLASDLPGGSGIDLALIIGEPPAQSPLTAVTDDQDVIVRTAQVRLRLGAKIVPPLAQVELPVVAELGSARARTPTLHCAPGPQARRPPAVTTPTAFAP